MFYDILEIISVRIMNDRTEINLKHQKGVYFMLLFKNMQK